MLWVIYGIAIGALPVVVANVIVAAAAVWSSFRSVTPQRGGVARE
jgi:hypothetical protein